MSKRVDDLVILLKGLVNGADPDKIEKDFISLLDKIDTAELAEAEDILVAQGVRIEDIQRANQLHTDLIIGRISDKYKCIERISSLEPGHPVKVFLGENQGISEFITNRLAPDLETYLKSNSEKDRMDLASDAEELSLIIKHYDRKENLLFPYLEKNGITAPPKVMWGVDDIIRQLLGLFNDAINSVPADPKRIKLVSERLLPQIESMLLKENDILLPMIMPYMTDEDWILVANESVHIGYVFNKGIEGASNSDAGTWIARHESDVQVTSNIPDDEIRLPSGFLSVEQMTAMLNTLPTDLTFIDSDDVIRYYSEGKHQVFTRTRTIIGRNVYLCHPPKLVPVIKKLIGDFREGRKDAEIVPLRKGSRLNLIRYYAVRDDDGNYMGTLEVTEEISEILDLIKE